MLKLALIPYFTILNGQFLNFLAPAADDGAAPPPSLYAYESAPGILHNKLDNQTALNDSVHLPSFQARQNLAAKLGNNPLAHVDLKLRFCGKNLRYSSTAS